MKLNTFDAFAYAMHSWSPRVRADVGIPLEMHSSGQRLTGLL